MKIKIVGSAVDGSPCQFAASYVINREVAIDAGSLGFTAVESQRQIKHLFLSHSHLDHIASLPIFLENVYEHGPDCIFVYASAATIDCLQQDFFNGRVWPDVMQLSRDESPHLKFVVIEDSKPLHVEGLTVTPVTLHHTVPTFGFLVEDRASAFALVSDTAATEQIWDLANANERLTTVLIECAFPNSMEWLADKTKHLTPARMRDELRKLTRSAKLLVIHIKPAFYETVLAELAAMDLPQLEVGTANAEYDI